MKERKGEGSKMSKPKRYVKVDGVNCPITEIDGVEYIDIPISRELAERIRHYKSIDALKDAFADVEILES